MRPAAAIGFGAILALVHVASWAAMERAITFWVFVAALFIGIAAALSAFVADWIAERIRCRPFGSRFAAAIVVLVSGTVGLASLFMAIEAVLFGAVLHGVPLRYLPIATLFAYVSQVYTFLCIAGFLLMPLGFPLILAAATLIAGRAR